MKGKITLIGAGSGMFSLNLVRDLCLTKSLEDCEVCMMDISPERLGSVYEFCVRYAGELGSKLKVSKTLDRKEALRGADFVINTALAAPYGRLRAGWEIGERYGYRFGGSLQIMHDEAFWINFYQFGLMEDILLDMRAVCPDAWYLIVANPVVTGVTYLKRKYPDSKIVGMCHGFAGIYRWCDKLNIRKEDISFESIGVNHFVFLNRFFHKGENAYPLIDKWIGDESQSYFDKVWYSDFEGPMAGWGHGDARRRLLALVVPHGRRNPGAVEGKAR
jgi:alpha-galactosidase